MFSVPLGKELVVIESGAVCTVSVVLPVKPDCDAEIVVLPADVPVASPLLLIVATVVFDEFQPTWLVIFCVLLSEYVPVAVNCCVAPVETVALTGVTAIEVSAGGGPACSTTSTQ